MKDLSVGCATANYHIFIYLFSSYLFIYLINVTNACENIVRGKSDSSETFHILSKLVEHCAQSAICKINLFISYYFTWLTECSEFQSSFSSTELVENFDEPSKAEGV